MSVSPAVRAKMPIALGDRDAGVEVLRILDAAMLVDVTWGTPSAEVSDAVTVTLTPKAPGGQPYTASSNTTPITILLLSTGAVAMTSNIAASVGTITPIVANVLAALTFTPADLDATDGVITLTLTSTNAGVVACTALVPGGVSRTVSKTFV